MKRTWKYKTRPLLDLGDHLGVPLNDGSIALVDHGDRDLVEGWNWSIGRNKDRVMRGTGGVALPLATAIMGHKLIDHVNGNIRDNRRSNLRRSTKVQNARNRGIGSNNTSGFKGVFYRKDRSTWLAALRVGPRLFKIGTFKTREEAARAYDALALQHHGEFAVLNFPGD